MPSHHHNHRHKRRDVWEELADDVKSFASEANPFKTPKIQAKAQAASTVYQTVYETMAKTFDGPIAGYSTLGQSNNEASQTQATATPTSVIQVQTTATQVKVAETAAASLDTAEDTPTTAAAKSTDTVLPASIGHTSSVDLSDQSTLAVATSTPTTLSQATKNLESSSATGATATNAEAAASASASASSTAAADSSSPDTGAAAKAGIAIGVLGGVLVVALLVFFLVNKRRKQRGQQIQDDEKIHGPIGGRPSSLLSTRTSATAPQVSLRPVTQFNPTFGERRSSKGAALALATTGLNTRPVDTPRSPWERPSPTSQVNHPENPFGNDAERAYTPTSERPNNPFENPENVVGVAQTTNSPPKPSPIVTAAVAGAGAVGGAAALGRKVSTRKDAPPPLDLTIPAGPPSPAGTEFSVHSVGPGQTPGPSRSAAAIAAAGGPPATAVHRVQLDFKPSLDDEMEIRAGQLVRLLHEYDDGWSLCIRLDRSKQGVVPRTCLSTRPVKPRPAGGPPHGRNGPPVNPSGYRGPRGPGPNYPPGQRPMTPQSARPQSPAMMRPQSPGMGRPMSPYGSRPASPANGRMSPGPRAQSPGPRQQRRMTPPGPSPMNPNAGSPTQQQYAGAPQGQVGRKPIPGQAY